MDTTTTTLPTSLRLRRLGAGMTLEVLSAQTGLDPAALSRFERGHLGQMSEERKAHIAGVLASVYGVTAAEILKEVA
jgi:transcriptional regulator with XRE-family HTH domain